MEKPIRGEREQIRLKQKKYKKERLSNENINQRFWRLIKKRQYRRKGYHSLAITEQYSASIGKHGAAQPKFTNCTPLDKSIVSKYITLFFDTLHRVESGFQILESPDAFLNVGMSLPKNFFLPIL